MAPITSATEEELDKKTAVEASQNLELPQKNTAKNVIFVKEAPEKGLPSYNQSQETPVVEPDISAPPKYVEEKRPSSPQPPAYDPNEPRLDRQNRDVETMSPAPSYENLSSLILDDGIELQESSDDEIETTTSTQAETKATIATTRDKKVPMSDAQTQTKPEPDELDKLFQEYRNFFRSEGEKFDDTLAKISARLECDFLLKDAVLREDGSRELNQKTSIRLKNFLENDPELKIGERKAIASSLNITLLDNGQVEKKSDLVKSSLPEAKAAEQHPSAPEEKTKIDGLGLIKALVAEQKAAAKKAAQEQAPQPVKNPITNNNKRKAVGFTEGKSETTDDIDKLLREKYGAAPNTKPKTTKVAKPLDGHDITAEVWL